MTQHLRAIPEETADQLGLAGRSGKIPETVRAAMEALPAGRDNVAEAEAYTRRLTRSHYENFSVVSVLLPKKLRQDFCNVYAFCRTADDLGDEVPDKAQAMSLLGEFKRQTHRCYAGECRTAVFIALKQTIERHQIPIEPFLDLIDAFEQDQRVSRYDTFEQLVDYCRRSADPVGRLVLYMCGYGDETRQRLSDKTCTGLQLANFWQDVRRDILERDRIYLPRESLERFGVSETQIREGRCDDAYRALLRFEVERTASLFAEGKELLGLLAPRYRQQIRLFGQGGEAILEAIRHQNYDTLTKRPRLSQWQKGRLIVSAAGAYVAGRWGRGTGGESIPSGKGDRQ